MFVMEFGPVRRLANACWMNHSAAQSLSPGKGLTFLTNTKEFRIRECLCLAYHDMVIYTSFIGSMTEEKLARTTEEGGEPHRFRRFSCPWFAGLWSLHWNSCNQMQNYIHIPGFSRDQSQSFLQDPHWNSSFELIPKYLLLLNEHLLWAGFWVHGKLSLSLGQLRAGIKHNFPFLGVCDKYMTSMWQVLLTHPSCLGRVTRHHSDPCICSTLPFSVWHSTPY